MNLARLQVIIFLQIGLILDTNKPYYVPAFNVNDRTSPNQLLYSGLYSPNMNSYYTPDYVSCNNWALIDSRVSEFHLNNISSGFSVVAL